MDVVSLNAEDDEILFRVAETLGALGEAINNGEEIEDLGSVLRGASMAIAIVMAGAYDRAVEGQARLN